MVSQIRESMAVSRIRSPLIWPAGENCRSSSSWLEPLQMWWIFAGREQLQEIVVNIVDPDKNIAPTFRTRSNELMTLAIRPSVARMMSVSSLMLPGRSYLESKLDTWRPRPLKAMRAIRSVLVIIPSMSRC